MYIGGGAVRGSFYTTAGGGSHAEITHPEPGASSNLLEVGRTYIGHLG